MNRRRFLALTPAAAVALPFGAARMLATRRRPELPPTHTGQVLTSRMMNDLIHRVNELSREAM